MLSIKSESKSQPEEINNHVVEISNLDHYYGRGSLRKQILFGINLTLKKGEPPITFRWRGINHTLAKAGKSARGDIRRSVIPLLEEIQCSVQGSGLFFAGTS